MSQNLFYRETRPTFALSQYIINYWLFENKATEVSKTVHHRALADGCTSLCFYVNEIEQVKYPFFHGPDTKNFEGRITPTSIYLGVRFRPGITGPLFGLDGRDLRGKTIWDPSLLPKLDYRLVLEVLKSGFDQFDLLDRWLQTEIKRAHLAIDMKVQKAVSIILKENGDLKIKTLAKTINLSERQLQRRFKKAVGLTPKEFARIRKIRTAVIQLLLQREDYQDVVYNNGYFDQAHFIHDFSSVIGTNPTLFDQYISQIEHVDVS